MRNEGVARVFIENVRRLGCGVALDDVGTGYGSFRYLKHLPVSVLKIDQEFVRDLEGEVSMVNRHVIEATVTLARGMGQKTIAEGVEPEATLVDRADAMDARAKDAALRAAEARERARAALKRANS